MRRLLAGAAALLLGFVALTGIALEAGDVAVLTTQQPNGEARETHVWWAEHEGAIWVEAATPERAWLAEALAAGWVELTREAQRERLRVERAGEPAAQRDVRALLREKYGLRDWWVGLLQDTSRSVAVRLHPDERATGVRFDRSPETESADLPFSDAVRVGDLIFVSGQLGIRPGENELVPGGIEAETAQCLDNIRAILERNGSSLGRVAKCTVFLADMEDWPAMNAVYRRYFPGALPARSALAAAGLAFQARIELECIAAAGDAEPVR